jgi:hypothetical protein
MSSKGSVKEFSSEVEMKQKMLEDNQARCDFFKYYQFDENNKLGTVSYSATSDISCCHG